MALVGGSIDLYRRHREEIAVVLLDVCIPDLDGFQTLEVLREINPEVQACFMSGNTGAALAPLRYREIFHELKAPLGLALVTTLSVAALPFIQQSVKKLAGPNQDEGDHVRRVGRFPGDRVVG